MRWVPDDIKRSDFNADPIGMVIAVKRRFARSPEVALDSALILFDEHVDLGIGGVFRELWASPENIEEIER